MNTTALSAEPEISSAPAPEKWSAASVWPLWFALGVGFCWLLVLALLALTTANPATLNLVQLAHSQGGILAEVEDPVRGTIRIADVIFVRPASLKLQAGETLQFAEHGPHWQTGEVRLLLLRQSSQGEWQITPTLLPNSPFLDYPADPALIAQIREQTELPVAR